MQGGYTIKKKMGRGDMSVSPIKLNKKANMI